MNSELHSRSPSGRTFDGHCAIDVFRPLLLVAKPVALALRKNGIESDAVIRHIHDQFWRGPAYSQPNGFGLSMFEGIGDRLSYGQDKIVPHFRAHGHGRQSGRHFFAAANSAGVQTIISHMAKIIHQARQVVVARIHRPDNFIQRSY